MYNKKILLVDDDHDFITAVATMLTFNSYETMVAYNGIEGYEVAQKFMPDLFILDVNMETESAGFELNKSIRTNAHFKTTPIIMLTGIDTIVANNQIVDMYNEMESLQDFDNSLVMKIKEADGSVAVNYRNNAGQKYFLLLDSFISKPVDSEVLLSEIKKFMKK